MQPLQSPISSPPAIRQAIDTPQQAPGSIKDPQAIKNPLQKVADKPSNGSTNNSSSLSNDDINLVLLSLINQLIEQMQGVNTDNQVVDEEPDIAGIKGKDAAVSETKPLAGQISASDDKKIPEEKPIPSDVNISSVSDSSSVSKGEANPQTSGTPSPDKSESSPKPDGLRSLEKFRVTLLGFSDQNNDKFSDVFKNTLFMGGRFHSIRD